MVGPVCPYTEMTVSMDLHNLLHFLALRLDSHAQLEIRRYAEGIFDLLADVLAQVGVDRESLIAAGAH